MEEWKEEMLCEAIEFTELLSDQYFVMRAFDKLPELMKEEVSWIGTGEYEISRNLNEARIALTKELEEYGGSFTIIRKSFEVMPLTDAHCVVYGTVLAEPEDPLFSEENLRLSLVLEKTSQGLKLFHLHVSHPDWEQEKGHYYVTKAARNAREELEHKLELRSLQLEILNQNIPGGAHQCKNDPNLTLISMSDSFVSMFGYNRREVEVLFHNHFIEMVYPGDRAKLLAATHEQLKKGRDIELEYRVLCKNGAPVWILDKGRLVEDADGNENFYCILIEISERKRAQEELRLSLERHRVIMDQATDIIFEWDIRKDTLLFSSNWYKKFGYAAIENQISGRIPISSNIHAEDMSAFLKLMKDTASGVPYSETEFRIKDITGRYYWCRIRATTQFDSYGSPIKAVGVIVDIDNEKKQRQLLLDMAQKDALTGLYNKATIKSLVEQCLERHNHSMKQAIMILDVDYFKMVNDTYGHLAGDSLLSDVAEVIKSHIGINDLAGRIGGDEFLIYFTEVIDEAEVKAKAEELLKGFKTLVPEPGAAPLSCSIGAAIFPQGAVDYYALYKCADQALYVRKKDGRKGVTFYQPGISEKPPCGYSESAVGADVGADEGNAADEQLAQYAFRMLYAARDIESAISRLLEIVGRSYDVSRVYICESSADKKYCTNTFEWCAHGVEPRFGNLQNILAAENLEDHFKHFDKRGIFYCTDVNQMHPHLKEVIEPRGICSMLQCAMLDEGEYVGYVGFDEYRENRAWSQSQVATFKLTADVLSTFLVKLRQKNR